jgi:hypothetical protein
MLLNFWTFYSPYWCIKLGNFPKMAEKENKPGKESLKAKIKKDAG